jgi:hypothetical protein
MTTPILTRRQFVAKSATAAAAVALLPRTLRAQSATN